MLSTFSTIIMVGLWASMYRSNPRTVFALPPPLDSSATAASFYNFILPLLSKPFFGFFALLSA